MWQIAKANGVIGERWRVLAKAKPFEPSRNVARHRQSLQQFCQVEAEKTFEGGLHPILKYNEQSRCATLCERV
jgi:hypothetical protein